MKKTIKTIYRFFIPDDTRLKIEAVTEATYNAETKKLTIHRRFYTFRAFASFALWYVTKNPYEKAKKELENLKENPAYAYRVAGLTAVFIFTALADIKSVNNVVLVAGAIAFDATTNRTSETGASTTFSHTTSGSNRVLTVGVASYRGLSSCTYAGTGMTLGVNASQGSAKSGVYYLGNPASGANNVVFTPTSGGCDHICAISFSGANTAAPNGVTGTNTGTNSDTISKSVTTTQANSFLVDAMATEDDSAHVYGADAGQTGRMWGQLNFWIGGGASTKPTTSVGSYTLGWTKSSGAQANNLSISVLEIKELAPQNYTQDLDETVTLVETRINQTGKAVKEAITLVDTMVRTAGKAVKEVVTLVETVIKNISKAFTDVITLVASSDTAYVFARDFSEEIVLSDTLTRTVTKVLTDTVTLVENVYKTTTRALTEAVTLVASEALEVSIGRMFTETITLVDNIGKATSKAFTEVVTLVETFAKRLSAILLTDVITLAETFSTLKTQFKNLTEQVTLVPSIASVLTATRALTETITLRARAFANGISLQWLNKYASKVGSWLNKYDDPK